MSSPNHTIESLDAFATETRQNGFANRSGAGTDATRFAAAQETELARQLLGIRDETGLNSFLDGLIERGTATTSRLPGSLQLRGILRQVATSTLPSMKSAAHNFSTAGAAGASENEVATAAGEVLELNGEAVNGEDGELETARRFVRLACASAGNLPHFHPAAPVEIAARRAVGAAVLQELYESSHPLRDGLVSFEYPLYFAEDEELDYFLGKLVRRVGKVAGGVAKGVGKGLSAIDKVVPVSMITTGLSMTPLGMAVNAGLGAVRAGAEGKNVFQGALRTLAANPATRFMVDTGMAAARGENIVKAAGKAFQAGIGDVRKSLQFAAMVAPFIPGVGTGVAAALSAANALASGRPISEAMIAAARGAVPGGAIAQMAFDTALNLAKGKNIGAALLDSARSRLPGGPAAQAAFDAAVTIAKGKSIQDAAFAATGRLLPASPYAADALAFVKKVASGQNIQRAALSSAGNLVLSRIERQTGPMFSAARSNLARTQRQFSARAAQLPRGVVGPRDRFPRFEMEFSPGVSGETQEWEENENSESSAEDEVFGEMQEMELAAQLLEITSENELEGFMGKLISRATGGAIPPAGSLHLRGLLCRAAKDALPLLASGAANMLEPGARSSAGARLAAVAGDLFGLELEGLSPEDQEFEVARRFVRFAGAGARQARRFRASGSRSSSAWQSLQRAARRHAPGFQRWRRRRFRTGAPVLTARPVVATEPVIATEPVVDAGSPNDAGPTGDAEPVTEPAAGDAAGDPDPAILPDNEPANSNEPQSQPSNTTNMHDLDHTTKEFSNEAENFEFEEAQEYGGQGETLFNEEEEAEFAANLLEINSEAELDHFISDLLRKAKNVVGGALKSPLLQPLGGFIKGAIKKVLPIAGGALGNMLVPGLGGQIGSRLAAGAGDLLGLELEGLSAEDQEFEVAKQLVRTVGTAVQNAANAGAAALAAVTPQEAAKAAMVAAARAHLPGLLQTSANGTGLHPHHHRPRSGRWIRQGRKIILLGV